MFFSATFFLPFPFSQKVLVSTTFRSKCATGSDAMSALLEIQTNWFHAETLGGISSSAVGLDYKS